MTYRCAVPQCLVQIPARGINQPVKVGEILDVPFDLAKEAPSVAGYFEIVERPPEPNSKGKRR